MIQNITLIGAGNLATQLGRGLKNAGLSIRQVFSRTEESAATLAAVLDCPHTTSLMDIQLSDLLIISVKDDALETVLKQLDPGQSIVVHTAGSVPMEMLAKYTSNFGVFYPLQTFSKSRDIDFSNVPICLESSSSVIYEELEGLAEILSQTVRPVNSEERKMLHLAAVFTCNFVNHFYNLGDQLLEEKGMDFALLKPLILETAEKVMDMRPAEAQTGPAVRFDETIINKHLNLLSGYPDLQKIYSFVSDSIYRTKNNN